MRYAVGDIHGYRFEMHDALHAVGLVDDEGRWCGADAEVWFAGDLLDRGPDGVGVISDVMRWQREAADAGGAVHSVLGNHEVLALGLRRFGDALVPGTESRYGIASFASSWLVNGGQPRDQDAMTDEMAAWLSDLPAVVVVPNERGDDVLQHADTAEYVRWGRDPGDATGQIRDVLHGDDLQAWWELWRSMTCRFDFLGDDGRLRAGEYLAWAGADRLVHGHSLVSDLRGIEPEDVTEPWAYADDAVLAVDGGIYAGGPCLIVPLDHT